VDCPLSEIFLCLCTPIQAKEAIFNPVVLSVVLSVVVSVNPAVAVFFNLEKAYDTAWRCGVMKDLHNAGLKGRLPSFIEGFLQDRHF